MEFLMNLLSVLMYCGGLLLKNSAVYYFPNSQGFAQGEAEITVQPETKEESDRRLGPEARKRNHSNDPAMSTSSAGISVEPQARRRFLRS